MKNASALALALILALGCTTAFAAGGRNGMGNMKGNMQSRNCNPVWLEQQTNAERPETPEMTDEQKSAMTEQIKNKLSELLESGKITQEQYDDYIARIESGEDVRVGFGDRNGKGFDKFGKHEAEASDNAVMPEKAEIPERPETPEMTDEQKSAMTEQIKNKLSELLESGKITQEQYDDYIAKIESGEDVRVGFGDRNGKGVMCPSGSPYDKAHSEKYVRNARKGEAQDDYVKF